MTCTFKTPKEALRYHVTGAIERGEKEAIVEQKALRHTPAPWQYHMPSGGIKGQRGDVLAWGAYGADAALMLAAPDLLNALIAAWQTRSEAEWLKTAPETHALIVAAITKAREII